MLPERLLIPDSSRVTGTNFGTSVGGSGLGFGGASITLGPTTEGFGACTSTRYQGAHPVSRSHLSFVVQPYVPSKPSLPSSFCSSLFGKGNLYGVTVTLYPCFGKNLSSCPYPDMPQCPTGPFDTLGWDNSSMETRSSIFGAVHQICPIDTQSHDPQ